MAYRCDTYEEPGLTCGIQLFIKYIPLEFDVDLLMDLFSEFGDVTDVNIPEKAYLQGHSYLFGYVTYFSKSDAMNAITALNGTPPYYLTVEVSKLTTIGMLRDHTETVHRVLRHAECSARQYFEDTSPNLRRHSSMGCNYKLTASPDGKRTIQAFHSMEQRRSVPFSNTSSAVMDPCEEDIPAPGQKQKFPCYHCGNLTFCKCACGGAYYCKEPCRMFDWPEHKKECIERLKSQLDFQTEVSANCSQSKSLNEVHETCLADMPVKTQNVSNRKVQVENDVENDVKPGQKVNPGQRQAKFPSLNDFNGPQNTVVGSRNNSNWHAKFPNARFADVKENSNNQSLNGVLKNDNINFDFRLSGGKKSDGNWGNHNEVKSNGVQRGSCSNQNQRKGFEQNDSIGKWRKESDEKPGHMIGQGKNFVQGDGDYRGNSSQHDGGNRRNYSQRVGDNKRNSNQRVGDRMNYNQRVGDNRRKANERDGERERNNPIKMSEKKANDWKGKHSEGSPSKNFARIEESWDQPDEVKAKVQNVPSKEVEKVCNISQVKLQKPDDDPVGGNHQTAQHLTAPASANLTTDAEKVVVILKEGPKIFFVQRWANNDTLNFISQELANSPSLPFVKPEVGMLCAAMFEGEWYRARILTLVPQLAVQYMDYGNLDICDPATLHMLPESIVGFPPMAEKIEFVDELPGQYSLLSEGDIVSVKPVGEVENGVMKVRLDDGKTAAVSTQIASAASSQGDTAMKETMEASLKTDAIPSTSPAGNIATVISASQSEVGEPVASSLQENIPPVAVVLKASNVFPGTDNIHKGEFKKAKIIVLNNPTDYWVTWEHNLETVDNIILKTHGSLSSSPLANPKVGLLCAAKFEGIWFRGQIAKVSPQLEVHYIDYGNLETCTINDLRDLPEHLEDFPPMAFRVRLAEGTPQEYHNLLPETFLSMKIVEQNEDGVCTVQIEGVEYVSVTPAIQPAAAQSIPSDNVLPSPQGDVACMPSKTDMQSGKTTMPKSLDCGQSLNSPLSASFTTFSDAKFCEVRVAVALGGNDYWVQRVTRDKELQFILVEVNDHASKCIKTTPEIGKLCATQFQSFWYRAQITKITPKVEVHFIDFGNAEVCESDILELPESVKELPPLALRIQLADGTPAKFSNLPVDSIISVKPVTKIADDVALVQVEGVHYVANTEEKTSQNVGDTVDASPERQRVPGSGKTEQVFTSK